MNSRQVFALKNDCLEVITYHLSVFNTSTQRTRSFTTFHRDFFKKWLCVNEVLLGELKCWKITSFTN